MNCSHFCKNAITIRSCPPAKANTHLNLRTTCCKNTSLLTWFWDTCWEWWQWLNQSMASSIVNPAAPSQFTSSCLGFINYWNKEINFQCVLMKILSAQAHVTGGFLFVLFVHPINSSRLRKFELINWNIRNKWQNCANLEHGYRNTYSYTLNTGKKILRGVHDQFCTFCNFHFTTGVYGVWNPKV